MRELLFIYDTEVNWASTTHGRRGAYNVGVSGGITGLKGELDKLVADGKTFERVMFYTHGNVGAIFFGDERNNRQIDVSVLPALQKYNVLFPFFCRMYFAGCNVADGDEGWQFLATAGRVFFPKRGGVTFGWTSKGFFDGGNLIKLLAPLPSLALSGHEDHLWGDARYVFTGPGGVTVQRWSESAVASMI
jgi:hypothetical protein